MKVMLAWYNVSDLEAAKKFYGGVLGLKKSFEMQGWAEYSHENGGAAVGLNAMGAGSSGQAGGATVVLGIENLDATMKKLGSVGVKFAGEIMEIPGVVRIATFHDPFGNTLQLAQTLIQQ